MANSETLQIRLSPELKALAEAKAERDGISLANVLRAALEAAVTKPCKRCKGSGVEGNS